MTGQSRERLAAVILIAACLIVYGGVAGNGFINFDDGIYILSNPHVHSGLTLENIIWSFKATHATNWHPLTWLSHMTDATFFGLNPAGHHLTSLFFHIANSLLLFLFLRSATGAFWESMAVAVLFALHPLRVESVAWISERKDVLSGFFAMLTLLAYVHYVRRRSGAKYTLTLLLFALGLMAKPMLVTLPFVLLLLDFWPLQRCSLSAILHDNAENSFAGLENGTRKQPAYLLMEKVPFFVLSAASSLITYSVQSEGGAVSSFEIIPLKVRVVNALVSYWNYLEQVFWPSHLAVFYPHPGRGLPAWEGILAAVFIVAVSCLVIYQARRRPFLLTGWFWFLGMMVPVIGIIQVGNQSMADRYTYLPSIGIFIILAWIIPSLPWRIFHSKPLLWSGFCVAVVSLSCVTWVHTGHWKDTGTLFRHAASVTTGNYLAHCFIADILATENKFDLAQAEYEKALAIWPEYPDALNNYGSLLSKRGLNQEAMSMYEEALRVKPNFASAHVNIANYQVENGDLDGALLHYSQALRFEPDSPIVQSGLGTLMARLNRTDEAIFHIAKAIELCPECPEPYNNLGRTLTLSGNLVDADRNLQRAIQLAPNYAEAYNNLGLVYLQAGALEDSLYFISKALHLKPDYEKARKNLRLIAGLIAQKDMTVAGSHGNIGTR